MKPLAPDRGLEVLRRRDGEVAVPDVDVGRGGRQVDREVDPAGERRAVQAVDAQDPQSRVARVLGAARVVGRVALAVEQVEAVVGEVRLDRAVAVHVEHAPGAPRGADRHALGVRLADRARELLDLPVGQAVGTRVRVRARVEDRLVREAEVLHARDERVLLERRRRGPSRGARPRCRRRRGRAPAPSASCGRPSP